MAVPNGDAMYYTGRATNGNISVAANETYPSMLSMLPPYTIFTDRPTENITTIQRLLIEKKVYTYVIISPVASASSELDTLAFNMGEALAADLRRDPNREVSYSVELHGTYSTQDELIALLKNVANQRPQPEVLVLSIPTYDNARVQLVLDALATTNPNPDVVLWLFPLDNPEDIDVKSERRRYKYHSFVQFWGDTLVIGKKGKYLDSAELFGEHYESRYSKRVLKEQPTKQAGVWEAVGAAHGVLLQLWLESITPAQLAAAEIPAADNKQFYVSRRDTFFNRVRFNHTTGRNDAYLLPAFQVRIYFFLL